MGDNPNRVFRFGAFEADEQAGELRKQGRRLAIQGQPLQVLLMLLERPGEIVSRAEIQGRLWSDGTFVDFDHSLNTAMNKIRNALDDSASSPRFVETLARKGYRFLAPVEVYGEKSSSNPLAAESSKESVITAAGEPDPSPVAIADSASRLLGSARTDGHGLPQASPGVVRTLFMLLQIMYVCFYAVSLARIEMTVNIVSAMAPRVSWIIVPMIVTAAVGIPVRLYLISSVAFRAPGLREKFLKIFPLIFALDELWALAPFLLVEQIGFGLALGATAVLLYSPFAQRALIRMGAASLVQTTKS